MRIHAVRLDHTPAADVLSASVDTLPLSISSPPGFIPQLRAEPFVVMGLIGAMARNETLEVSPEFSVSPRLLASLGTIQDILKAWVPALHKVEVIATPGLPPGPHDGAAIFFSGGVDATYSFLKHEQEISHLIAIHGLDIPVKDESIFSRAESQSRAFASRFQKALVPVRTNARDFADAHRLGATLFHGAILASTALALGFRRTYVGSSDTYRDLIPWGSHPLLDPLWSTEASELVHDGCEAGRAEKLQRMADRPEALSSLRVCCENTPELNCGRCEKCVRTMMALRLAGTTVPTLPLLTSMGPVRRLRVTREDEAALFADNLRFAREKGDQEAVQALRACLRRHEIRQFLRGFDRVLGDPVHKTYRWVKHFRGGSEQPWIELIPCLSWLLTTAGELL